MKQPIAQPSSAYDVVILGGGMVGLSLAQLIEKGITNNIAIVDKEHALGMHSSGRNSGVLHAGIYYKPNTVKSRVCVDGAKRLGQWIQRAQAALQEMRKDHRSHQGTSRSTAR